MPIHRRQFIGGVMACCCGGPAAASAERTRIGCYASQGHRGPTVYEQSSGAAKFDTAVTAAVGDVSRVIGRAIPATIVFTNEDNAQFNPKLKVLAFGKPLLAKLEGSNFKIKITCIAAHEIAHIIQAEDGYFDVALTDATVRRNELMADTFAGCCLAFIVNGSRRIDRGKLYRAKSSVQSAFQLMFSRGDTNFTNPTHHGTPKERLDAVDDGYETAFEVAGGNPVGDISKDIMDSARSGLK